MSDLYREDYYQWVEQQKGFLERGEFNKLDTLNIVEVMRLEMGSTQGTLESHLTILLLHLLKYQHQTRVINPVLPEPYNCRSWFASIDRARMEANTSMRRNPSLKTYKEEAIREAYPRAKKLAIKEMNPYLQRHQHLNKDTFPETCPWSFDQLMMEDWLPE